MEQTKKENPAIFFIFYFIVFLTTAISGSFLTLYLKDSGTETATIGLINGAIQIISLLAYPLWGYAADHARTKNRVLIFGLCCGIAFLTLFSLAESLVMMAVMMILFSVVNNPMMGIYETITMEHVTKNGWNYSPIRLSGTIGYALMSVAGGYIINANKGLLFPLLIGVMLLSLFFAFLLPKTRGHAQTAKKGARGSVYALLKKKNILRVLVLYGMYSLMNSFNMTYFGIYITSLGGNYSMVGIANMIMAVSEIPFHIGPGRRWMQRIGIEKSLLIMMGVGAVRWTICALSRNVWVQVSTMALSGVMLVPTIVGVIEFLYENAPDHLKASAQTALRSPFQVGGQLIANVIGGGIVGMLDARGVPGIRTIYAFLAPICLIVGLIVGVPLMREERAAKQAGDAPDE